jgi:hypothetical protein
MACAKCEHRAVQGPKPDALLCTVLQMLRALLDKAYRLKSPYLLTGAGLNAGCYMVREVGLEPTRHCCRQDLNLVRLPISPLTRVYAASLKRVRRLGERVIRAQPPCTTYRAYQLRERKFPGDAGACVAPSPAF